MSSDTDHPRQRTVAELLAEHGGGAPTGRRRRRREEAAALAAAEGGAAPVITEVRPADPAPAEPGQQRGSNGASATAGTVWGVPEPAAPPSTAAEPVDSAPSPAPAAAPPVPDWPTEQMPSLDRRGREVGHTGPMERLRRASPRWRDALDAVERTERELRLDPSTRPRVNGLPRLDRGGPEAPAGELFRSDDRPDDGGPPTRAGIPPEPDPTADAEPGTVAKAPRPASNGAAPTRVDRDVPARDRHVDPDRDDPDRHPRDRDERRGVDPHRAGPYRAGPYRADLYGADPYRAGLSSAGLSGADPSVADPSVADPSVADPSVVGLSGAGPSVADLSGADLSGADPYRDGLYGDDAYLAPHPADLDAPAGLGGTDHADGSLATRPDRPPRPAADPDAEATVAVEVPRRRPAVDGHPDDSPAGGRSVAIAWVWVIGQWLAGALGGAALWVCFRYLWRSLPVVALAAAALVTVGLVLLVRSLLRSDGPRTTVLAVLVGLVLTVSPAILVLLDR